MMMCSRGLEYTIRLVLIGNESILFRALSQDVKPEVRPSHFHITTRPVSVAEV